MRYELILDFKEIYPKKSIICWCDMGYQWSNAMWAEKRVLNIGHSLSLTPHPQSVTAGLISLKPFTAGHHLRLQPSHFLHVSPLDHLFLYLFLLFFFFFWVHFVSIMWVVCFCVRICVCVCDFERENHKSEIFVFVFVILNGKIINLNLCLCLWFWMGKL